MYAPPPFCNTQRAGFYEDRRLAGRYGFILPGNNCSRVFLQGSDALNVEQVARARDLCRSERSFSLGPAFPDSDLVAGIDESRDFLRQSRSSKGVLRVNSDGCLAFEDWAAAVWSLAVVRGATPDVDLLERAWRIQDALYQTTDRRGGAVSTDPTAELIQGVGSFVCDIVRERLSELSSLEALLGYDVASVRQTVCGDVGELIPDWNREKFPRRSSSRWTMPSTKWVLPLLRSLKPGRHSERARAQRLLLAACGDRWQSLQARSEFSELALS